MSAPVVALLGAAATVLVAACAWNFVRLAQARRLLVASLQSPDSNVRLAAVRLAEIRGVRRHAAALLRGAQVESAPEVVAAMTGAVARCDRQRRDSRAMTQLRSWALHDPGTATAVAGANTPVARVTARTAAPSTAPAPLPAADLAGELGAVAATPDHDIADRLQAIRHRLARLRTIGRRGRSGWDGPQIVAVIPAHNEADQITATLHALQDQDRPPNRTIVVADNCTDDTVALATAAGAEVFVTHANQAKKAGALNQCLAHVLPTLADADILFVQDADSQLDSGFLACAQRHLARDLELGGCGGTFRGGPGGGFVGQLQRAEYARYGRDVRRLKGKVLVLTGTATAFRVAALRDVLAGRADGSLPESHGVYDETVLTEDNELSQALLHRGWKIRSPKGCTLVTEVMCSWGDLYRQRLRWKRGAVENLRQYGLTRITWRYWGRQLLTAFGCLVTAAYLATIVAGLFIGFSLRPIWLIVTVIFALERAWTARDRGWRWMLVASVIVVEMVFDVFLQATHLVAYSHAALNKQRNW